MKNTSKLSLLIMLLFLFACSKDIFKGEYKDARISDIPPPGTVDIGQGVFYDYAELSNLAWKEYTFWLKKHFGKESVDYLAALPDTTVWVKMDSSFHPFSEYYWQEGSFNHYPVVGISQAQAQQYAKWRSDRVMEMILINNGFLAPETERKSEQYFSLDRLLAGMIELKKPLPEVISVPVYRLPEKSEWKQAVKFNDSLYRSTKGKDRKMVKSYQEKVPLIFDLAASKVDGGNTDYVLAPADFPELKRKSPLLYQLKGNVSEWSIEKGKSLGGNFTRSINWISMNDEEKVKETAKANLGFRNVCEWQRWKSR